MSAIISPSAPQPTRLAGASPAATIVIDDATHLELLGGFRARDVLDVPAHAILDLEARGYGVDDREDLSAEVFVSGCSAGHRRDRQA